MIRDKLVPLIEEKYGNQGVRFGMPPEPIVVFPARHTGVGDLTIWDDGEEATVEIGELTHGHFGAYDVPAPYEAEDWIVKTVLEFLKEMFADRYLLWKSREGGSGGWAHLDYLGEAFQPETNADYFVWSGPYEFR